eukprot:9394846-Alexandrium_andersonii.AAC.1
MPSGALWAPGPPSVTVWTVTATTSSATIPGRRGGWGARGRQPGALPARVSARCATVRAASAR